MKYAPPTGRSLDPYSVACNRCELESVGFKADSVVGWIDGRRGKGHDINPCAGLPNLDVDVVEPATIAKIYPFLKDDLRESLRCGVLLTDPVLSRWSSTAIGVVLPRGISGPNWWFVSVTDYL